MHTSVEGALAFYTLQQSTAALMRLSRPAGLQSLAGRFMTWQATRPRGQRIPTELWRAATAMARVHGINPTVAALKINYYDLQRRLHHSEGDRHARFLSPAALFTPDRVS